MGTGPLGLSILPDFLPRTKRAWPSLAAQHGMSIQKLEALRKDMQDAITSLVGDFPAGWGIALQAKDKALYDRYMRLNDIIGIRNWRESTLRHDLTQNREWVAYEHKRSKNPFEAKYQDPEFVRLLERKVADITSEIAYRKRQGTWRGE